MAKRNCSSVKRAALALLGLALAGPLAGCGTSDDTMASLLVDPGKYQFFDCAQLAEYTEKSQEREQELEKMMARAEVDPAGRLVSAVAYQSEYLSVRGNLTELRRAAAAKDCKFQAGHVSDRIIR